MPRRDERRPRRVQVVIDFESERIEAHISDISASGCYVDTRLALLDGEAVSFDVIHQNGERLAFTGDVMHHEPGRGFGLKFSKVSSDQKYFLERILLNSE